MKSAQAIQCKVCANALHPRSNDPIWLAKLMRHGVATRFKPGQPAYNQRPEVVGLPRNKFRQPLNPCPDCGRLKLFESERCYPCANIAKRKTETRKGVGGYMYGATRIPHGTAGKTRAKPLHVEIAEKALGRLLKRGEHVHHINCDRADNRNCNLLICSASYHAWLHGQYAKRFAQLHLTR